jgi:hypothetical protein
MAQPPLLATITGDHFQPVRLHYRVLNRPGLLRAFEKLRCLDYDSTQKRWVWLYGHEAKNLRFKKSYAQLPKELHPIVIGSFFLRTKETLLLDLRSCERALLAIPFFDSHLPRRLVELTDAEVVNRLFPATRENMPLTPDRLFDRQPSTRLHAVEMLDQLSKETTPVEDLRKKLKIAREAIEAGMDEPLPEMELMPVHFAEDGIVGFQLALRIRQMVAFHHFQGNTTYSVRDAIREVATGLA